MQFKSIGSDVTIYPLAKIIYPQEISIGNSVIIDDFVLMIGKGGITIGDFVHIASFVSIVGNSGLVLEDFTSLSPGVRIFTGDDDYSGRWMANPTIPGKYRGANRKEIVIEKHAMIGANSVILPGVRIGEGVRIGANSLVKHDCVSWMMYAGNPVKPIRKIDSRTILMLESELRKEAYDEEGDYIPKELWR